MESKFLEELRGNMIAECEKVGQENLIFACFIGDPATGDLNTSIYVRADCSFISFGLSSLMSHLQSEFLKQDAAREDSAVEVIN